MATLLKLIGGNKEEMTVEFQGEEYGIELQVRDGELGLANDDGYCGGTSNLYVDYFETTDYTGYDIIDKELYELIDVIIRESDQHS
jgi:hypothetical protein